MSTSHFERALATIMKSRARTPESLAADLVDLQGRIGSVTRRLDATLAGFGKIAKEASAIRPAPLAPIVKMAAAEGELKAKAAIIQKTNPALSAAGAYDQALNENPNLYSDWLNAKRARDAARR